MSMYDYHLTVGITSILTAIVVLFEDRLGTERIMRVFNALFYPVLVTYPIFYVGIVAEDAGTGANIVFLCSLYFVACYGAYTFTERIRPKKLASAPSTYTYNGEETDEEVKEVIEQLIRLASTGEETGTSVLRSPS
jgi:hypothetical protein